MLFPGPAGNSCRKKPNALPACLPACLPSITVRRRERRNRFMAGQTRWSRVISGCTWKDQFTWNARARILGDPAPRMPRFYCRKGYKKGRLDAFRDWNCNAATACRQVEAGSSYKKASFPHLEADQSNLEARSRKTKVRSCCTCMPLFVLSFRIHNISDRVCITCARSLTE